MARSNDEINAYIRANSETQTALEMASYLNISEDAVRGRRRRMKLSWSARESEGSVPPTDGNFTEVAQRVVEALKAANVSPEAVGNIRPAAVSLYQSMIKDENNEAQVVDLNAVRFVIDPSFKDGPDWQPVDRAAQVPLTIPKKAVHGSKLKRAVILPDPQIGYRQLTSGLDPFHDETAMTVALQIVQDVNPDLIVNLGDFLDFNQFARFLQEPRFALTTQPAIDRGYRFLAEQRQAAPNAHVVVLEGNHDLRLPKSLMVNAAAAWGIGRAECPDKWPVMTLPYLLRFEELGVEYVDGYPNGSYWITDNLKCIHGVKVRSNGSTAHAVVSDTEDASVIFGHVHRIEKHYKTKDDRGKCKTRMAYTPGTLARIDGAVPSTNGATDSWGAPVKHYENWQQGIGVVEYDEETGFFQVYEVHIHNGSAVYGGNRYEA